jgi:hypothetical protein
MTTSEGERMGGGLTQRASQRAGNRRVAVEHAFDKQRQAGARDPDVLGINRQRRPRCIDRIRS